MQPIRVIRTPSNETGKWKEMADPPAGGEADRDFFANALSELKRYSRECAFPEWQAPRERHYESRDHWCLSLMLPGLDTESLALEIRDSLLTLKGVRHDTVPGENRSQALEFRRLTRIPVPVSQDTARALYTKDTLFLIFPKRPA